MADPNINDGEPVFAKGDTVYNLDGQEAEYIQPVGDEGHLVRPVLQGGDPDDGWTDMGSPTVWDEIYRKAPVPKFDAEIAEARAELDELLQRATTEQQALYKMQAERRELQRDQEAVRTRLKENEALRNIDAFLAGKITHFVTFESDVPEVQTAKEALEHRDGSTKTIRLLGLFGDEERSVRWKATTYGDGSGSMKEVFPCLSLEEAQERARNLLTTHTFPCIRSGKLTYGFYVDKAMTQAAGAGVQVPQDVADKVAEIRAKDANERLTRARQDAERHNVALAEAETAARAVGVIVEAQSNG